MIWSKTKKALEALLANSVKAHVQYHVTSYVTNETGIQRRAWITWDGKELANFSDSAYLHAVEQVADQLQNANNPQIGNRFRDYTGQAEQIVADQQQILPRYSFDEAVERYLSLSIDDAVIDKDPVIKALAMLDRRIGKRRLKQITIDAHTHPLVKQLYERRVQAEAILLPN